MPGNGHRRQPGGEPEKEQRVIKDSEDRRRPAHPFTWARRLSQLRRLCDQRNLDTVQQSLFLAGQRHLCLLGQAGPGYGCRCCALLHLLLGGVVGGVLVEVEAPLTVLLNQAEAVGRPARTIGTVTAQ